MKSLAGNFKRVLLEIQFYNQTIYIGSKSKYFKLFIYAT